MKDRLRRVLSILLERDGFVPVSEVASLAGAGVRTVFRDIQELEYRLRDRNVSVEKRRSLGVRLTGDVEALRRSPGIPLPRGSLPGRLSGLGSRDRQLALLAYLARERRVVKLSEAATLFFVSDSCVSGDLKDLDSFLETRFPRVFLERQRGVGVCLSGTPWDLRMAALHALSLLIPTQELIQYVLGIGSRERLGETLALLGYGFDRDLLAKAISNAESRLGYRLSWRDLGLLFLYLSGILQDSARAALPPEADIPPAVPAAIAGSLLEELGYRREGEAELLAMFLSALEPGEIRETNRCHPDIDRAVSSFLAALEREKAPLYAFDSSLYHALRVGLSALVYKKLLGLPPSASPVTEDTAASAGSLAEPIESILAPIVAAVFGVETEARELVSIGLTVRSAEETLAGERRRLRVVVSCFEGIFLAQFISTLLTSHFPEITVVSALSCDRVSDDWVASRGIDLVVTTFPIGLATAPEYTVAVPFDSSSFRAGIAPVIARIASEGRPASRRETGGSGGSGDASAAGDQADEAVDTAMKILSGFTWRSEAGAEGQRTALIARLVCGSDRKAARVLREDLERREALGEVILEDSGIRLYHCRSRAVKEPRVGVIGRCCYIVAPEKTDGESLKALSRISEALIENADLAAAILRGGEGAVKRQLFSILAKGLLTSPRGS